MNAESLLISRARFDAVIFDLDGVVTKTARVHAASWKRLFDNYLRERATREGVEFSPFDAREDYLRYVDGKPRYDGVQSFLESRGIALPRGKPEDAAEMETVCGLGNRKNALFLAELKEHGVEPYETTICFIRQLRALGFKTAIISSSKNCATVLEAVGATELFNAQVDGVESARIGIAGKPAPGIFLEAARRLGVGPARAVVVEDAISGVEAGRAGGFGCVVGVNRGGDPARLAENTGLFRLKDAQGEWDVFCVTLVKVVDGQQLDLHLTLQEEATIMFGHRPLSDGWLGQDAMLFYFQRRHHPEHKKSLGTYGACQLDERSLRALAEEIDVHADSRPFWTPDLSAFVIGFKRFLFNVLLFLGSLPEEYEPEKVVRPAREKKGRFRPELRAARFLGKEAYRPARRPTGAEHEPTGRQLPGHWRAGHWRRQAFGEGSLQRKLIWIQPYKTASLDA